VVGGGGVVKAEAIHTASPHTTSASGLSSRLFACVVNVRPHENSAKICLR
jgi:hypothetical protein